MSNVFFKSSNNSKEKNLYEYVYEDSFDEIITYQRFLNWISGEFTLNLQEDTNGLTIYFPNGWFSIKMLNSNYSNVHFKIEIKSKCFKKGAQVFNKILSILTHIKTFKI